MGGMFSESHSHRHCSSELEKWVRDGHRGLLGRLVLHSLFLLGELRNLSGQYPLIQLRNCFFFLAELQLISGRLAFPQFRGSRSPGRLPHLWQFPEPRLPLSLRLSSRRTESPLLQYAFFQLQHIGLSGPYTFALQQLLLHFLHPHADFFIRELYADFLLFQTSHFLVPPALSQFPPIRW